MTRKTTILEELTKPNPVVINRAKWGTNTTNSRWAAVEGWALWRDFNAEKLNGMFGDLVDSEWTIRNELHGVPTKWDGEIFDEDELEHTIVSAHILPPVNAALQHALKSVKKTLELNLGRAGRTYYEPGGDRRFKPDWALCSSNFISTFEDGSYRYDNIMPGDSKLSIKWKSTFYGDPGNYSYWADPVRQIVQYCIQSNSRYGFIITDEELVVIRIRTELTGAGLAATRSRRVQPGHSYNASTSTDASHLSTSMQGMSIADTTSSYQPTDAIDEYPVEYQSVSWSAEGKGKRQLTVRLALFYLACMAGIGENRPQPGYPSFDSSWYRLDGACIHNSTGLVSKKPKKLEYPDPSGERGPRWITFDDDGDDGEYLILQSVLTLDVVVERDGRSYYYYVEEDQRVLISTEVPIYDEDNDRFGYFEGVAWRDGNPPESTKKNLGKHSKSPRKSPMRKKSRR